MTSDVIKILKVEKVKNTYLVTTNEDQFKVDEDTLIKHLIMKDKEFTKAEFKKVLNDNELNKLFYKVLKYLSYGERTESEIRKYLNVAPNIDKVIKKLKSLGYIDDISYCHKYLDYCYRNNKGPLYCETKLYEKGINKLLIEEVVEKYTIDMQNLAITNIVNKELKNDNKIPVIAQKRRLTNKLLRDGFSRELVYEVVNKTDYIDNSDESLKADYHKQVVKLSNKDITAYEKKQRIRAYLLNKGYEYQKISEIIE